MLLHESANSIFAKKYIHQLQRFINVAQLALLALMYSVQANAFEDPINSPAIHVPSASQSLLLDVARTGERIVAVGERGHIIYSDDYGETWAQAEVPVRVMLTAVTFPQAGASGWAVGHQGVILVSHDGGLTWNKQLNGHQAHQLMADAFSTAIESKAAELEVASDADRERLQVELENLEFMLDDSLSFVEDGPVRPFVDVWFKNALEGYAVGSFGLIVRTEDGGKSWHSPAPSLSNPDARHYNAIDGNDEVIFIAGESGHLQRSTDDGISWETLEPPYEGSFFDIVLNGKRVLLLGLRGNAFFSDDNGNTWSEVESVTVANLSKGIALDDGRFVVSQYAPQLLILDEAKTSLEALSWSSQEAISSFLVANQGSIITVGTNGVMSHSDQHFSVEVK